MGVSFAIIKIIVITFVIVIPLLIVMARRFRHGSIMLPKTSIIFTAALLPLAYAFSAFFASDRNTAILGFNFNTDSFTIILLGFLSFMLIVIMGIHKGTAEKLYKAVKYISGIVVIVFFIQIIAQFLVQSLGIDFLKVVSSFSLVNSWLDVAMFAGLLIIFLLNINSAQRKDIAFTIGLLLFLGIFTNVTLVFILLAFIALIKIVHIIVFNKHTKGTLKKSLFIIPGIVILFSGFFIIDSTLLDAKISNTIQGWTKISFVDVRPNWKGTLDVAKGTVMKSGITEKLFGPGVGSFSQQWRMHKPSVVNTTQFWSINFTNAIGFIPTSIITGGAVVFAAWIVFLFTTFLVVIMRNRNSALGLAMFFIWIFAILNPIDTFVLIIAFIITGLFVAELGRMRLVKVVNYKLRGDDVNKLMAYVLVPVVFIGGIAVVFIIMHRVMINSYLIQASDAMVAGNMNDAEIILNKAKKITNAALIEQGYTKVALAQLSTLLQKSGAKKDKRNAEAGQKAIQASLSNVLSHAQRAIERDPKNPVNYIVLGNISEQLIALNVKGATESALAAYTQAAILDTKNPEIPFAIARVYSATKNNEKALKALEVSLSLKPNYQPALYQYELIKLNNSGTKKDKNLQ